MSRRRAALAILLALAWCAVAWHGALEGAGWLLEHQHHAHDEGAHPDHHAPDRPTDDHDPFLVRDVVKDGQIRLGATALVCFGFIGALLVNAFDRAAGSGEREPVPFGGWTAPPFRKVWQFAERCAPESAAPPARG